MAQPKTTKKPATKKVVKKTTATKKAAVKKTSKTEIAEIRNKVSNDDIKNYLKEIELQKQKRNFLEQQKEEENSKIEILNKNITKLDRTNNTLEKETKTIRKDATELSKNIVELRLSLEKAEAESKIHKMKQVKRDILINAKILKDQEETIAKLKAQKEAIREEQKRQRDLLLEKRSRIEEINKNSLSGEFKEFNSELVELMQSTLASRDDKTQLISTAMDDASKEMNDIKSLNELNQQKTKENIELLKTQMINLNSLSIDNNNSNEMMKKQIISADSISPKSAKDIEEETTMTNKLDKLVLDGLITEEDKENELIKFRHEKALIRLKEVENKEAKKQKSGNHKAAKYALIIFTLLAIAGLTVFAL